MAQELGVCGPPRGMATCGRREQVLSRDTRILVSLGNSAATRWGGMVGSRANHCVYTLARPKTIGFSTSTELHDLVIGFFVNRSEFGLSV